MGSSVSIFSKTTINILQKLALLFMDEKSKPNFPFHCRPDLDFFD